SSVRRGRPITPRPVAQPTRTAGRTSVLNSLDNRNTAMADLENPTPRQKEIYQFIRGKIQGRGYGPTGREIRVEVHIKSPNGVMCHLKALQKKGLIHREPNMSRAIQLLDDPATAPRATGVKLVGRIAAGPMAEAIEQADEELEFAEWEGAADKFALRV